VQAVVPPSALRALSQTSAPDFIRAPFLRVEQAVNGEEAAASLAAAWHDEGLTGKGVKVAVIDGDPVMRGLPKDGIPAIDRPVFVRADYATFMDDDEYVIGVFDGAIAKAYSTWHLNGHEIVNDTLGSASIAVTW